MHPPGGAQRWGRSHAASAAWRLAAASAARLSPPQSRGIPHVPPSLRGQAGELLYVMRCTREEKGVDADRREEEAQAGLCSCAEQPAAAGEGEARRTGA